MERPLRCVLWGGDPTAAAGHALLAALRDAGAEVIALASHDAAAIAEAALQEGADAVVLTGGSEVLCAGVREALRSRGLERPVLSADADPAAARAEAARALAAASGGVGR